MRLAITITVVLIILYAVCCRVNSWDIYRYKRQFDSNRKQYNELVEGLKKCPLRVGYTVYTNELPEHLQELIDELNITNVNSRFTPCDGKVEYQFESLWSNKIHLFFTYNTCEIEQSALVAHVIMSEMIELWGLGKGWVMMIDYDFI
jgi:hypothetical protein